MDSPSSASGSVSLRHVAGVAGVSRMTVSRAFKPGSPIKPELRAKVLAVAKELGYSPDRMVTELMTSFVKRRPVEYRETFAALWWPERWNNQTSASGYSSEIRHGLEAGAARHGCAIEHIVLSTEMSDRSLARMLKARGINGIVLTPPPVADTPPPDLNWSEFSAVIVGASLRNPRLHRAQASHYTSMVQMLETVRARGYRKPALLVRPDLEDRMQRAYSGAFLAWEDDGAERIWRATWAETAGLATWLKKVNPDVLIADTDMWRDALPAGSAGGIADFASMAVEDPAGEVSGHRQNIARVSEGAVDLLVQARLRHETGVPAEPSLMLVSGFWVEGRTLKRRAPAIASSNAPAAKNLTKTASA